MSSSPWSLKLTLNITIVNRARIYQSADFQISKTEKGPDGNWIELQPNSPKIVSLRQEAWSGFLTYCGIGLWKGKATHQYASEWLTGMNNSAPTFQDAVEKIREHGSRWIATINQAFGKIMRHSFVLAGYQGGAPSYAVVSNYQTLTREITPESKDLKVDIRSSKTGTYVFVTGLRSAVPGTTKRRLKHLVQSDAEANVVRYELAKVNESAALSPNSANGISRSCLAYSLDANGQGAGEVYGDVRGPLVPRSILAGVDVTQLLGPVVKSNPNIKFVENTSVTSESHGAVTREHIECELRFNEGGRASDTLEIATVEEIGHLNEYRLSLHALNSEEYIVGQLWRPLEASPHAFVRFPGREVQDLGTLGGPVSNALSINDNGQVVGAAHLDHSATHAFLWDEGGGMRDLGTLGGRDSVARCINNVCHIVGDSFVGAGDPKQEAERAFLWTPQDGMINLGNQFEAWSRGVAVNNKGMVVGWRLWAGVICGFVWSSEFGPIDIVGKDGRAFLPCSINDSGLVIGEGDDSSGKRRAFSWTREDGLRQLAVPEDFHPADVNAQGNLLGNIYSRPWLRPGLRGPAGEFLALPFVEEHNTSVQALNRNGVIIGAAWTASWKHSHPLIWRLRLDRVPQPGA